MKACSPVALPVLRSVLEDEMSAVIKKCVERVTVAERGIRL